MLVLDPVRLFLAALACYRLAQLVAIDDGPGDVFRRLRGRFVVGFWAGLVHCPYCLGVWWAVPFGVMALVPAPIGDMVLVILGLAGAQAYLQGPRDSSEENDDGSE